MSRYLLRLPALICCLLPYSHLLAQPLDERQARLLAVNCLQCHTRPASTAPQLGVAADWEQVRAQQEEVTLRHVVEGLGGMPPLGYCSACSEDDLRQLSSFLAGITAASP